MGTPFQESVFTQVRDHFDHFGYAPLIREIEDAVGAPSSMVRGALEALIHGGRLERTAEKTRNLRLAGVPDLRAVGTEAMKAELARRGVTLDALSEGRRTAGRTCAVDRCDETVRRGMLMCRRHWFSLSPSRQNEIKRAFGAKDEVRYAEAVEAAKADALRAERPR